MLRPAQRTAQQIRVIERLDDNAFVRSFRMFDRWATDTLPLAGEYFRQTTKLLMWENRLLSGTLDVGGRRVDLGRITAPFLHVAAEHLRDRERARGRDGKPHDLAILRYDAGRIAAQHRALGVAGAWE